MAKFRVEMVDGRTYEVEAPEGTPQETLFAAIQERNPLAFKSTEALEAAPSAPFKAADIGRAAKAGIAGGLQSLTDIFGAGNVASQYLEEAQKAAYQGMSPERIEEMQRREEIKKRAEGKGLGKEISSYLGGFAEAPLQTAVQALAGSAPIIASSALPGGPAAGIARLLSAARGPTAVGAAMGLGGQKGQDYETVKQALLEQGVPEPEAERRAQEASAYSMQNILRQAGAAAAGAAEGRFGVEPAIGKLLTRRTATGAVKPPTWDVAIGQSILGEAAPEALQAAVGQLGTNQALNQAGIPTEITKGLAGTVAHDALVGAVLGLGLSPAQKANMARDYAATQQEERNKRQEEERAKIAEIERKQREEYEKAGYAAVQKPLAPADLTKNPLGSFTAEDLQPEVVAYIDNYRNQMGLPKIQQYSVEDIADAMPGLDKKREREALGEIVGKKAGYTPEATVSVQNVLDQALAKNIDIEGKGFTDFLARTTGVSDFKEMTNPQLFAAYKAISALPDSPTVREMEAGTNAVRFDDTQYTAGLNALDITLESLKRPVSVAAAVDEIKFASGLRSDKAANALLEEAIRRGDLDETQTPRFEVVRPSTGEILGRRYDTAEEAEKAKPEGAEVRQVAERQIAPPTKVAALPEGYDIQEGLLKTGEAPQAFDVKAGDQILSRVKSEEEAQAKLNSYSQTRAAEAANAQKVIERQQKRVVDSAQRLNAMEAGGQGRTAAYQNMAAKHARLIDEVNKIIARQNDRIKKFDPSITPITISPVGAKAVGRTGFTVLKGGVPLTTLPTREAAERAVLGDLTTGRLEELAQKKERRGLGPKAAEEIERRAGRLKPEKSPEVEALEQNLRKVLDKFGLKDVALEVAEAIAGGKAGGSYLNSLIKVALDEKNPVRTLRHESLHALRHLGFFTDQQWNALTNQARSKWIDTYLKQRNIDGEPLKAGETSRYDAYVMAYKGDIDAIVEEAIADAFADFDVNKAPPGMLSALLNKLRSFFEALRNVLSGAGFQTAEDVFGKVERAELAPTKKAEGAEKLSVKGQEAAQKVIDAVQDKLIIDPKLYSATSLEMQTGKSGDRQFKQQDLGGIPEIVNFLEKRRRDSGVPILDISKPADRELLSQLMAAEAMASINAGGAALEWYDETVAKTIGMAALKYQELGTDPDKQMAFKIATAIASQGMNVEDNLKFAMQQYDYFDKNGRFEELGKGTDASAMRANYVLANKMMDEYTLGELRKFLQTPFKVEELRAAGFKIGGELGEETVLGSSIFGPKIGFGFYSNLNGNFEPVTMDMWFMRLIGRLTGNLRVFEADLFKSQMDRFRQAFDEAGVDGVYADEFKSDIVEKARKDDDEAVKLARIVNSVFTSDFKNNRALYDEGAKKKTELVYAAQNVLKSVDSPKDAPDNGTERIQLRDVVKRTVDRIERAIGKRIPPASLQALVWYPEQELYKALGAKLRVTSQDYAGAMKKILEGEGYGTKELDAAARSGARQVQQMANKPVGPAVKPTGEKPTAPYTEGERAEFLERATTKSIIEQERKAPKRRKVVFEVAPDPNNIEVTAAWRQLPTEDRLRISEKVAKQMLGRAMEATGASGRVVSQVGSYLEDTNPSFALFLDKGNSVDVSKFLGYVLGQDSMMVISPRPGPGLDKVGAVIVDVNTNDSAKIDAVYQKLREIEVNNEKPVGGQSTMNGKMIVLNYSNLETEQLAQAIRSKLQGEYDVAITDVYSAFPEKDSYDYSDPSADPRGAQGDLRRTARTLRDQATEALAAELQTAAAPKEKLSLRAAEAPPSGVPADIWQMHTQLRTQEAQLSGELPMPTRADGTAQTAGVLEGIQKRLFRRYNAAVKALVGEDESLPFMQRLNTISSIQDAVREGDDQALETYKVSSPEEYAEVMGEKLSLRSTVAVDKNGKPLRLYHATYSTFDKPKINYGADEYRRFGFHVGPLKAAQSRLAIKDAEDRAQGERSGNAGPNIIPVYLDIRNPLRLDENRSGRWGVNDIMQAIMSRAEKGEIDGISQEDVNDFFEDRFDIEQWLDVFDEIDTERDVRVWNNDFDFRPGEKSDLLKDFINQLGYDSIVYKNEFEGGGDSFIALDPSQVKSQFRPEGKFSLRAPQTPEFKQWFGNSKIVDENGEPKVMYHGTARDFEIFQPKQANAIFLTDNPKFAEDFSDFSKDYMRKQLWNSSAPEQHFAWLSQATDDAFKNGNISPKDRKEILADLKTIESQGAFGSLGFTPVLIEAELFKILDNNLPVGENIIPVYVKAENPFDFDNPTHARRLMAGLKNQISGDYLMTSGGRMAMKDVPTAIREGSWKIIEAEDVQEVLRDLFDGFYVKEGGVKNLAVYKPNQIKSVFNARPTERPEMRLSLRSGADRFNQDEIEKLRTPGYKSREKLIDMPIRDFLLLAEHGYVESKQKNARELLAKGEKFSSIPYLKIDGDRVFGHEGRHRARALQELGYTRMPVLLRSSNIRWSEQNDPEKFDYIKDWPKILRAEERALDPSFAIPFPVKREESEDAYQPTPERFSIRASIDPSLMAMVDRTTHQRDEKTFIQSITEAIAPKSWSHFRQQALNRYNRLSEADKVRAEKMGGKYLMADASAESAALMSDLAAGVSASALGVHDRNGGIPVYRNGITTVWNDNGNIKGPTAIFAPLAKYNDPAVYQLYQFWAGSKRARRLYDQGKERLYTPAEITRANELLQQFPEFEDIQKEWVKYNNGLMEYAVATGVLSRERADEFMRYSDYVPFYRQLDGEGSVGPKIFQAISGVKPPKKIKGGEQPLDDFLETVVRNTQSIIQSGMKNVAAQRAVKLAVDIDLGERLPKKASGPDIVTVLENGQEVSYAVADPLFIEAVKSLNLPDLPFIGLLSGPANLLRNLVTKDPGFMLANMMRDSMAAWVTSGVNMTPVSSTVINFGKAFAGKSPEFQALLNAGVIGGYEFSQNVIEGAKTLEKSLGKAAGVSPTGAGLAAKPFTSLWETLEKGTTASDAATRMEVYKQVLAETGNEAEALYRALEVMNFNRKGSSAVVRILTAAVPFLNARMQGLDVLYRAAFGKMANKDAAAIQRAFFVRGMSIAAISCMYWALTHDDDEYKKQEEETKDNNWLIPSLGVKIPIPFEVGVLFKVMPERIMAYTFGEDTGQDFLKSMGRNLAATLMINPIPQTVLPVVEATTNFSFFTMRPIVGQGMADVAAQFQVGPSTSIIAEEIGGALGISPMKLDHMIKGYTGTMGMYMVDLIDSILNVNRDSPRPAARFEQLPVIKRFALDPEARGNVTAYYDLKNSVDETVRTGNFLERSQNFDALGQYKEETMHMLATRDYVLDLEKTMKELREVKVRIRASDLSSEEKRDALIEVNRREDQLTKNIREVRAFARQ